MSSFSSTTLSFFSSLLMVEPVHLIVYFAVSSIVVAISKIIEIVGPKEAKSSSKPKRLPQLDPVFGLDTIISSYHKLRLHKFLSTCQERFAQAGNTYEAQIPGSKIVVTCEPENLKAVLATQHQDFELGNRRKQAFHALLGNSIFASDGHIWKGARQQLRPSFSKNRLSEATVFETHTNVLVEVIRQRQTRDGSVDLQDLFFRLSLDIATEFFFGESCHSLSATDIQSPAAQFADAFNRSQQTLVDDFVLGSVAKIVPHPQFRKDRQVVQSFAEKYVRIAIEASQQVGIDGIEKRPCSILEELAKQSDNVGQVRDQALSLLVAGRDTTASLLSNLFFILSQKRKIWDNLQDEVKMLDGKRPDLQELKSLKYLQGCLRESLRLHPPVPVNIRQAVRTTFLPRGGGENGDQRINIPKDTIISYCVYAMHRRKDIWGEDAAEFRPERWHNRMTGWEWLPFNGGPRICLGQQLALAEAAYTVVKILQQFDDINPLKTSEWSEQLTLTCCVEGGVNVRLRPRNG